MEGPFIRIEDTGKMVPLRPEITTIGRGRGVDIRLNDPSVSRLHAEFIRRGPYLYVVDLGLSRNGTREEEAEKLASTMRQRIDEIVRRTTKAATIRSYYHELDNTYYSATSNTFIGSIYTMFGLRNIADKFDSEGSGYPKLSVKNVVAANPDIIFLADTNCCGQNAATVAARPGWEKISAVRNKRIVALDDDIASRWGPRLVDLVQVISQKIR